MDAGAAGVQFDSILWTEPERVFGFVEETARCRARTKRHRPEMSVCTKSASVGSVWWVAFEQDGDRAVVVDLNQHMRTEDAHLRWDPLRGQMLGKA
jgi:hypothetical protein